ncbi:glycosyltransferase [Desulfosarcina ovata]|uniref:Glycosyl transferase family 1 domain-containing protein n=1 Tax=Desulfosarcina ovata subsp. ovata TaxID=2752305 RepID=A0A5K8A6R8_9BACT|nr:glycosyltransferase [Desulfosarcina ovata]BBO88323.1 hypothetical protein DSCOOX_15030 [Desulfosarcina ovata subsp. ovata]
MIWKKLIFRLDELLSIVFNVLLLLPVLLAALGRKLFYRFAKTGGSLPSRMVFLSSEGIKVAPTRVRSYHFAKTMQRLGEKDAFVFAYWDTFGSLTHFPFPFRRIWEVEKFFVNFLTLIRLLLKGPLIIIEQRPNYGFIVPLYLKLLNGSRVFMDIDDWTLDYLTLKPLVRIEVRHLLSFFGTYCDTCIVSSRRLQERLTRHFENMHLLPTYVDHHRFTPAKNEKNNGPVVFSWVGTIFQDFTRDNVLFIIEAFAEACDLLGEFEKIRLDIVGGGDYYNAVEKQVKTRFSNYPIVMIPWLNPKKMPAYLQSIDVGLYCLLLPSLFQESKSPTKIFEYYACAKPVISTSLGEAKYFVETEKTGILADSVNDYANAIIRLFKDAEMRISLGREGLSRVEREWNMDAACASLRKIVMATVE